MTLKRLLPVVLLVSFTVGFALASACTVPPPTLSPAGQTAFTADQAVVRVNELMNAAIAANSSAALDAKTTRLIVTFAVDADQVLAKTPAGYVATVQAAWAATKPQIPTSNPLIAGAVAAADAVIGGLK